MMSRFFGAMALAALTTLLSGNSAVGQETLHAFANRMTAKSASLDHFRCVTVETEKVVDEGAESTVRREVEHQFLNCGPRVKKWRSILKTPADNGLDYVLCDGRYVWSRHVVPDDDGRVVKERARSFGTNFLRNGKSSAEAVLQPGPTLLGRRCVKVSIELRGEASAAGTRTADIDLSTGLVLREVDHGTDGLELRRMEVRELDLEFAPDARVFNFEVPEFAELVDKTAPARFYDEKDVTASATRSKPKPAATAKRTPTPKAKPANDRTTTKVESLDDITANGPKLQPKTPNSSPREGAERGLR